MEVRSGNIPSPSLPSQMRINFTYNKLNMSPSTKEIQPLLQQFQTSSKPQTNLQPLKKSKAEKRISGRLCSEVFNISYAPMEESIRKNRSSTSLFRSRYSNAVLKPYESKITSAQTTVSGTRELKDSEIPQYYSRSGTELESKNECGGISKEKKYYFALADQLPSSKRLDKTVMIPQKGYDFGGLMPDVSKEIERE